MTQLEFSYKPSIVFDGIAPSVVDRFIEYNRLNPTVFEAFKVVAVRLKDAGVKHYGSKAILEILRYETAVRAGNDLFKINNDFSSAYARLMIWEMPEFQDFFELRKSRAAA